MGNCMVYCNSQILKEMNFYSRVNMKCVYVFFKQSLTRRISMNKCTVYNHNKEDYGAILIHVRRGFQ